GRTTPPRTAAPTKIAPHHATRRLRATAKRPGAGKPEADRKSEPGELAMTKEIRLNAFDMNCVVHQSAGLWTHPRDHAVDYTNLEYWSELAQILERGR